MATRYSYPNALRTIGQELEKRGIDLFELRRLRAEYYLQCGDPTPPHVGLLEITYSDDELISLDLAAANQRGDHFRLVDFEGLAETLRALGRYLDSKDSNLLRIDKSEPLESPDTLRVEYESRDGRIHVERLSTTAMAHEARLMYMERSRISGRRTLKR